MYDMENERMENAHPENGRMLLMLLATDCGWIVSELLGADVSWWGYLKRMTSVYPDCNFLDRSIKNVPPLEIVPFAALVLKCLSYDMNFLFLPPPPFPPTTDLQAHQVQLHDRSPEHGPQEHRRPCRQRHEEDHPCLALPDQRGCLWRVYQDQAKQNTRSCNVVMGFTCLTTAPMAVLMTKPRIPLLSSPTATQSSAPG